MEKPAHFVIVGGGTAGWIAAFIIQDEARQQGLDIRLSVVESSKIPTVGVGEATTAAFRVLLKHFGIDEFEFFRKTDASFKLGIRHEDWRRKGFTYYGPIDDPHQVVQPPTGARLNCAPSNSAHRFFSRDRRWRVSILWQARAWQPLARKRCLRRRRPLRRLPLISLHSSPCSPT